MRSFPGSYANRESGAQSASSDVVHRARLKLACLVRAPVSETGLSTIPTSVQVAEQEWLEHSRTFLYLPP